MILKTKNDIAAKCYADNRKARQILDTAQRNKIATNYLQDLRIQVIA